MNRFLEAHALAMTPLTPIHIGCGEDFEPTNYVIEAGMLHHFDPARLQLSPDDVNRLKQAVNRQGDEAIRAVQNFFFHQKREACIEASRHKVPVAAGIAEWYARRVGRVTQRELGGRTVSNQLEIERTAHHPHDGRPYLPGSSLKGAMRTAWLNHVDQEAVIECDPQNGPHGRGTDIEPELLGYGGDGSRRYDLHRDPFRLVKVADASGDKVASRVVFSVDHDKEQRHAPDGHVIEKKLFVRREVIVGGQLRALSGEIRFDRLPDAADPTKVPAQNKRIGGFADLARACNRFYVARLHENLALIRRRFADDPWVDDFVELIRALRTDLDAGRVMLLRVGRHSGAESVTLDKRRWIQIRGGKRRPTYWSSKATTIWLAAEREDSRAELLPFGFLLIELADAPPSAALARWCETETARTAPRENATRRGAAIDAVDAERGRAPEVVVWEKARLRFNRTNKTLTAIGPGGAEANALAPKGEELLATLPADIERKVRANEFVRVVAHVQGVTLVAVATA